MHVRPRKDHEAGVGRRVQGARRGIAGEGAGAGAGMSVRRKRAGQSTAEVVVGRGEGASEPPLVTRGAVGDARERPSAREHVNVQR